MELKNRLENETRELQNQMVEYERNLRVLHNEIKTLQDMERKLRDEKVSLLRYHICDCRSFHIQYPSTFPLLFFCTTRRRL